MNKMPTPKKWTKLEEKILRDNYTLKGIRFIAQELERSYYSVKTKARDLGIMRQKKSDWKEWEKRYVERHYGKKPIESIARTLGKRISEVISFAEKDKAPKPVIKKNTQGANFWSVEDDIFLRKMYGKLTRDEIAQKLNRTAKAVARRAERLRLKVKK